MFKRRGKIDVSESRPILSVEEGLVFEKAIQLFNQSNKLKNLSEHTLDYYSQNLNSVRKVFETFGVTKVNEVTEQVIKGYIEGQINKNVKTVTINTKLRALRAIFKFLYNEAYILNNPMENIKLLKNKGSEIQTLTKNQIKEILKLPDTRYFTGFRDYVIILLILETGVRIRELCDTTIDDVYLEDGYISVFGKNGEKRTLPIQTKVKKYLKKYLEIRGEVPGVNELFLTEDNLGISTRGVQERFKRLKNKSNISNVRLSPHTLRHTFAKLYIQNGGDVFSLQKILGHKSMEMVRVYVNMFSSDVKDAHKKFSPVERL